MPHTLIFEIIFVYFVLLVVVCAFKEKNIIMYKWIEAPPPRHQPLANWRHANQSSFRVW